MTQTTERTVGTRGQGAFTHRQISWRQSLKSLCLLSSVFALVSCTAFHSPEPYLPNRTGLHAGETITVGGNENIYVIAREHNVSMRELIVLNDLRPPFSIRPGQTLVLPAGGSSFAGDMKPPQAAPLAAVEKNTLPPIEPPSVTSQPLEPVAPPSRASGVPQSLTEPSPVAAVTNLKPAADQTINEPVQELNRPLPVPKPLPTTTPSSSEAAAPQVSSAVASAAPPMRWPLQGPILSAFGAKGKGLNNDGVNIGAPKGSSVVAAASGTVVYAGDEMKGFGNLVLIRHQGDWVTAYAHLDRVLVKKDSIVGQGDTIGTVGKTGNVASPQLHFETRHSGKPVDPAGVIKGG